MVGRTAEENAIVEAVELVDKCVKKLTDIVINLNEIIITADHGNADEMFTIKNGVKIPKTSHILNPVPFVIIDPNYM